MNADEIVKALRHCYQEDIHGCEDCPLNESDLCYEANLELSAADLIESLQAQLAESQRRERAAIEDILCNDHCDACKFQKDGVDECEKNDFDCENCQSEKCVCRTCRDEDKWQWRGPQEGEPHETV